MHNYCIKREFLSKATHVVCFANLNVDKLFLLCKVEDKIDTEQYQKINKTNSKCYRASYFHESKN